MIDITYKRIPIEEYPPQGSMDEREEWMAERSRLFVGMAARYYARRPKTEQAR